MQTFVKLIILTAALQFIACGNNKQTELANKRKELEEKKKEQTKLNDEIVKLETELAKIDKSSARSENAKLVIITPIATENFSHFIELQGKLDAENISYVAPPNGQGGVVTALYVKKGSFVRKGQALARLDAQVLRQQVEQVRTQLSYAQDVYRRTKNLWDQGIGTEVQVLSAKNNVDNLYRQIATLNRQIGLFTVVAPMSGIADEVNVRVGELFTGTTMAGPQIRIVNLGSLKAVAQVPENYLNKVRVGSNVQVYLPDLSRTLNAKITVAGKLIDPATRAFYIEAKLPNTQDLRPNQVAIVKIQDYAVANAITIPINILQNDEKGKFVMVAVDEKGKKIARKTPVIVGELYGDKLEIRTGLQAGDQLITNGFQSLYDGQVITTESK